MSEQFTNQDGGEQYYLYYPDSGCVESFPDRSDRQHEIESWGLRPVSYIPIDGTDQLGVFMKTREGKPTNG